MLPNGDVPDRPQRRLLEHLGTAAEVLDSTICSGAAHITFYVRFEAENSANLALYEAIEPDYLDRLSRQNGSAGQAARSYFIGEMASPLRSWSR